MKMQSTFPLLPLGGAKPWYVWLFLLAAVLMLANGSCKKEQPAAEDVYKEASTTGFISGGLSDDQADAMVTQFYSDMRRLSDQASAAGNISLQQAVLGIEAVYNKYVVVQDYASDIATGELTFKVSATTQGSVDLQEAANTFWSIKAALLARQSGLKEGNAEPTLEAFDLEAVSDADGNPVLTDGYYTLRAFIAFAMPGGGLQVQQNDNIFTQPPTHCWRAYGSTNGTWPSSGQGTIDHSNRTIVPNSINLTKPSAPTALRAKGIYNYREAYGQNVTGYAYNITTVGGNANYNIAFPVMSAVNCDYVTRGIVDYNNIRYWNTKKYPDNYSDPYVIYKNWLTTPMMNFYLKPIKDVINLNIASGKYFYDFHILQNVGSPPPGQVYNSYVHDYYISSCRYLRFAPQRIRLNLL